MLDDLDLIQDNLSIVEKSFVTLGKPWRLNDTFIYIRDTKLLLPGGKRLKELGIF